MSSLRIAAFALMAAAVGVTGWSWRSADQHSIFATAQAEPRAAMGADQVNFRSFHDRLAPFGTWMNHRRWGAVWRPNAGRGFRPYRDGGHWENTDEYGTVWVSDYGWGDVPFHYGRWVDDPDDGWIWVPGYVWGPAWVVWRAGAGNVGWLPMPPWMNYDGYGAFPDDWSDGYGYADNGFTEDAFDDLWCFVDADDLYAPSISYYVIGPRTYRGFIGRTVGWTRFSIYHGHVFNRSIERDRFHAAFGHDPREGRRHDFEGRLGPVIDYASGHEINGRERSLAHPAPAASMATRVYSGSRSTPPSFSSHSVNVYRGSPSGSSGTAHHFTTTSHAYHVTPTHHRPTTIHPTVYRAAPTYHATPSYRPAPHGAPPPRGTAPHS
jgi:hypothetical protein